MSKAVITIDEREPSMKKLGLNRVSVNICSKKSEKTSGGEYEHTYKNKQTACCSGLCNAFNKEEKYYKVGEENKV